MIKVFSSNDAGYAAECVRKDIKKEIPNLDTELDYVWYRLDQDHLEDIVSEASMASFSGSPKALVVTQTEGLFGNGKKFQTDKDIKALEDFIQHPDEVNYLYFIIPLKTGNSRLGKELKKHSRYAECPLPVGDDLQMQIMAMAAQNGSNVSRSVAAEIGLRAGDDWNALKNTMLKLSVYTDKIDMPAVNALVPKKPEDKIFAITNAMFSNNPVLAIKSYRDMRKTGTDALGCLAFFYSDFRFLTECLLLREMRFSPDRIALRMDCSPYRVKAVLQQGGRLNSRIANKVLCELHDIEEGIKYELDDPDVRIEMFIYDFGTKYLSSRR